MSSPVRLLLCSGSDREGASALAQSTARATSRPLISWQSAEDAAGVSDLLALVEAAGVWGGSAESSIAWRSSSLARSLVRGMRVARAADGEAPVVVDCGESAAFTSDVNDLHAVRVIAGEALRPELLMDDAGRLLHARISSVIEELDLLFARLGDDAVVRLAMRPGMFPSGQLADLALDLSVLGLVLDGVVIAPATKERGKRQVARCRGELKAAALDARVWRASTMRAAPKGCDADGRLGLGRGVTRVTESPGRRAGEYAGACAGQGLDSPGLRIGTCAEYLVLATPRVRRLLALPSTLVRCTPVSAGVDSTGAHVHFTAAASLWPETLYPGPARGEVARDE